jgi:hypothetical protein
MEGSFSVVVNEGVLNIYDKRLDKNFSGNVDFENIQPSVTIPGKGVILPSSNKLVMPFEAVNLKAVDVTIIKIYENNIPQYLQSNNLDGSQELRRVGRPVVEKTIRLDADKSLNLHKHNRFFLDLIDALGPMMIMLQRTQLEPDDSDSAGTPFDRLQREHEAVATAVLAGDVETARAAMRVHLGNTRRRLAGGR